MKKGMIVVMLSAMLFTGCSNTAPDQKETLSEKLHAIDPGITCGIDVSNPMDMLITIPVEGLDPKGAADKFFSVVEIVKTDGEMKEDWIIVTHFTADTDPYKTCAILDVSYEDGKYISEYSYLFGDYEEAFTEALHDSSLYN